MKITIHGQDYTAALDASRPLTVDRTLNAPSICRLWLSLPPGGELAAPARFDPLTVAGDDSTAYFTGYIAVSPLPEYAGLGLEGPRYRIAIQAVSDEILLDQMLMPAGVGGISAPAGSLMAQLVTQSGSTALATQGLSLAAVVSNYSPQPGANWSRQASQAADMARSSYHALNGALTLSAIPATVHPLNETDGSLTLANLSFTASVKRALANDVTVCGENEPVAYATEYFLGDGATSQFYLSAEPYFPPTYRTSLVRELFNEPAIDGRVWGAMGSAGSFTLGANGLAMNGGNGIDGQTMMAWLDSIEMGGTLLLEAVGVKLAPGSNGIVGAFFMAQGSAENCAAGFQSSADPATGAVVLQPLVEGNEAGVTFTLNPANQYTLRVRVRCPECERSRSMYYSFGDNGAITAGGKSVIAPGRIQMEVQEFVNGVGATPVTLYDGAVDYLPGSCLAVPASCVNLTGSMRAFNVSHLGSGWVTSTPVNGGPYSRRLGAMTESAECTIDRTGKVIFFPGVVPAAGEQIAVSYRTVGRAIGRAVNTANQQALAAAGAPAVASWIGTVTSPPALSSADCRYAAQVIAQAAASTSALWSGSYKGTRASFAADVWPGDALLLTAPSTDLDAQVVVRRVKLTYTASVPDLVEYEIAFANDWADDLAIKTSATVPENAWLPAPISPTVLDNLNRLTVTALSGSTVTIDTGVVPPAGGGFEIRLRDFCFMPGEDPTLTVRTSAQTITFSRGSIGDRFYIRMYDGATPPNYSEFSAALFLNLPVG